MSLVCSWAESKREKAAAFCVAAVAQVGNKLGDDRHQKGDDFFGFEGFERDSECIL